MEHYHTEATPIPAKPQKEIISIVIFISKVTAILMGRLCAFTERV